VTGEGKIMNAQGFELGAVKLAPGRLAFLLTPAKNAILVSDLERSRSVKVPLTGSNASYSLAISQKEAEDWVVVSRLARVLVRDVSVTPAAR